MSLGRVGGVAHYLASRPTLMLVLVILFAIIFRVFILYPSWAGGFPAGFDTYVHAGEAYFIAEGGREASPTSPIYPPVFLLLMTYLYLLTRIAPIYLIVPFGIAIDVLCIPPMFYICRKISGNNEVIGFLGAFFTALNPVSIIMLAIGVFPEMLATLFILIIISILLSSLGERVAGIILMGLLGALVFLTNILAAAFYAFFVIAIFLYRVVLRRESRYFKPFLISSIITVAISGIYYLPKIGLFYVGLLGGTAYLTWVLPPFMVMLILLLPVYILLKARLRKRYVPAGAQHLKLLEIWYLTTPLMAVALFWQVAVLARLWHFITFPAIVVFAIVLVNALRLMRKRGRTEAARVMATTLLLTCVVSSYAVGAYSFNVYYNLTPQRLELINWIEADTPTNATFCTEEEFLPTHLGWYIMGLAGRVAFESILNFSGPFEVGADVVLYVKLANNITTLEANTTYWIKAVKDLGITYVVLLASKNHTNYDAISSSVVFANVEYKVYDVTEYALS